MWPMTWEKNLIKGSLDFIALNYYFPYMTTVGYSVPSVGYWEDENITTSFNESWKLSETGWGIDANGLKELLIYSCLLYTSDAADE